MFLFVVAVLFFVNCKVPRFSKFNFVEMSCLSLSFQQIAIVKIVMQLVLSHQIDIKVIRDFCPIICFFDSFQ